jgi:hypothetical protein
MIRLLLIVTVFAGCSGNTSDPSHVLEQRHAVIDALIIRGTPDAYATLVEVASGEHQWPEKLDPAAEAETRCMAQRRLGASPVLPQLGIGRVWLRFVSRMSWPRTTAGVAALLSDKSTCTQPRGPSRTFADAAADFLGWCPIPALRKLLVERRLAYPLHINDVYLSQRVGPAATRIEDAVAKGDASSFVAALRAIETTPAADRAEATREGVAAMNWLRHLVLQDPKYACCGPLQAAVREGPLGEALLAHLKIEPDPALRIAIWDVFSMQPKNGSRAAFGELLAKEPDPEVRYSAAASLEAMDLGGERELRKRQDMEDGTLPGP